MHDTFVKHIATARALCKLVGVFLTLLLVASAATFFLEAYSASSILFAGSTAFAYLFGALRADVRMLEVSFAAWSEPEKFRQGVQRILREDGE